MKTPLSSMLLVFIGSFVGSFGAVLLKAGARHLHDGLRNIVNFKLALGIGAFLASSYLFVLGLRNGELSVLYPLVAVGYIWTLLWSRLFFKEPFTQEKFIGLILILTGVAFIGIGNAK